jgi:hypothetical protein
MTRLLWLLLALVEIAVALILGWPGINNMARLMVFSKPRDFFGPDSFYFMRMLRDDLIRIVPAAILIAHATWIARRRISLAQYRVNSK